MNKFILDYDKKTIALDWENENFTLDLNEGDVGDYWNSITHSSLGARDVNFYQEASTQEPTLAIYGLEENDAGVLVINTGDETLIEKFEQLGDPKNYFGDESIPNNANDWIHNLTPIIDDYKDGQVEQLDEEDVDNLIKILKAKINLREGNISRVIYNEILG